MYAALFAFQLPVVAGHFTLKRERRHRLSRPPQTVGVPCSGQYACLICLSICARFFRCPLPARTADGRRQLVGQLSAVARADGSLAFAVLDICYGTAGVSMWTQRERSLTSCSLMALMR